MAVKVVMPKQVKTERIVAETSTHDFDRSPEDVFIACKYLVRHNDKYKKILEHKKHMTDGETYDFSVIYNNRVLSSLSVSMFSSFKGACSRWDYKTDVLFIW